jgi:hypothetical protein
MSMNDFKDTEGHENSRGGWLKTVINPGTIEKFGDVPVGHRQMTLQLMEDQVHILRNTSRQIPHEDLWKSSALTVHHIPTVKRKELRVTSYEDFTQTWHATVHTFLITSLFETLKQGVRARIGESSNHRGPQRDLQNHFDHFFDKQGGICKEFVSEKTANSTSIFMSLPTHISNRSLKHTVEGNIEGRIEVTRRRGRRCREVLDYLRKREDTINWRKKH